MMQFQYDCTHPRNLNQLFYIIDNAEDSNIDEFKEAIGDEEFEKLCKEFGYDKEFLPIEKDWYITYHKGLLENGKPFVFMRHSGIEYIYY